MLCSSQLTSKHSRPFWAGPMLFTVAWLAFNPTASAQVADNADSDLASPLVERSQEFVSQLEGLESEVELIESEFGPFDRQLLEPLDTLARLYLENEDRATAQALLEQQLQILRISDGLYSTGQIPIIETILDVATRAGDWQKSNDSLEYLSWLYQRDTSLSPQDKLNGMRKISTWHLLALGKDLQEREAFHLVELAKIEDRISEIAVQLYGEETIDIVPYIYNQALADMYIALAITITHDTSQELLLLTEGIQNRPSVLSGLSNSTLRTNADIEAMYGSKASTVIERSFKNNMNDSFSKLERIKEIYIANGDIEAEAMALMYLGDSVLIRQQFENRPGEFAGIRRGTSSTGNAMTYYREALDTFAKAGLNETEITNFTSCPVLIPIGHFAHRLPSNALHCHTRDADGTLDLGEYNLVATMIPGIEGTINSDEDSIAATVVFDVRTNGQIGRKDIIEITPDDTKSRVQVRKLLEITQFRPAIIAGDAVRTEQIRMQVNIPASD